MTAPQAIGVYQVCTLRHFACNHKVYLYLCLLSQMADKKVWNNDKCSSIFLLSQLKDSSGSEATPGLCENENCLIKQWIESMNSWCLSEDVIECICISSLINFTNFSLAIWIFLDLSFYVNQVHLIQLLIKHQFPSNFLHDWLI
jgi:hypothetical protein